MEMSRIVIGALFLIFGILLFGAIAAVKLKLEDEVKGGTGAQVRLGNMFPIGGASRFSEKGNALRKKYNALYYTLLIYSLALIGFMHFTD
jgi:hypothetical protein